MSELYLVMGSVLALALAAVCTAAVGERVSRRNSAVEVASSPSRRGATRIKSWAAEGKPSPVSS